MTPERIAELKALCEKATKPPWIVGKRPPGGFPALIASGKWIVDMLTPNTWEQRQRDAELIAAARTALPEALAEVERLRAEVAAWRVYGSFELMQHNGSDEIRMITIADCVEAALKQREGEEPKF